MFVCVLQCWVVFFFSSIDTGLLYSQETNNVSGAIQNLAIIFVQHLDRVFPKLNAYPSG